MIRCPFSFPDPRIHTLVELVRWDHQQACTCRGKMCDIVMAQLLPEHGMDSFTIRDLRERTGDQVRNAETGHLSVVAKHGHPLFVAAPLDETELGRGVNVALACRLFQGG